MSHRRFVDGEGRSWVVKVVTKGRWQFEAGADHGAPPRVGSPPLYAGEDPFELSEEELRAILSDARPTRPGRRHETGSAAGKTSPFGDVYEPPAPRSPFADDDAPSGKPSPFGDAQRPPERRSPFRDDR